MYKATIVIPNINGKGWLKDSIESVYAQTEQNFRLIVVDNGSTDESLEQARSYCSRENFTLIENGTNTGFSHAVNQGIALADSEYVVLFNNDAFAEPQWLEELIRTAETDPKIFAVQSLMIRHFDRELADDAGDYVTWMGFACKTGDGRRASRYTRQKRIFSACIIHFAASKAVGESVQKPLLYYRNNIVSLVNLLELMPKHNVKGIIFSSSCTVYGQPKPENLPVTEDAPHQKATSPYGNTKEINEQIIADYIHSGAAIKSIILRYFNPIGAHPSAEIGELPNGVPNNLIPFVTQTAIGIRKELTIFGNDYNTPDGTCIRDYIYVVDLAKAHVAAMARVLDKETEPIEYFNIGTGNGNSTLEIVETFEKATGVKLNWKYGPRREGDIEKIWGDCSKANKVLGWKAESNLSEVLASAWKWQLKLREDGIM